MQLLKQVGAKAELPVIAMVLAGYVRQPGGGCHVRSGLPGALGVTKAVN